MWCVMYDVVCVVCCMVYGWVCVRLAVCECCVDVVMILVVWLWYRALATFVVTTLCLGSLRCYRVP